MKIFGRLTKNGTAPSIVADGGSRYADGYELVRPGRVMKLSAYLDGLGAGSGEQPTRGFIYQHGGSGENDPLLAVTDELLIPNGAEPAWHDLWLPEQIDLATGEYRIGLHFGSPEHIARLWAVGSSGLVATGDSYVDGPAPTFGVSAASPSPAVFATYTTPVPTPDADDAHFARRGFDSAQLALRAGVGPEPMRVRAVCGWHGTFVDAERQGSSFAIVQRDGPLVDYIGKRIRVALPRTHRSVVAYVHTQADLDSEDEISLTRRLFAELDVLATDALSVTIEELA